MQWDFTVIPYVLLLLKFFDIAVWSQRAEENFNWLASKALVVLALYCWVIAPLIRCGIGRLITSSRKLSGEISRL